MLSLGAILYIFARALPRIDENADEKLLRPKQTHWIVLYLERADVWLKSFFEKFLRRARVLILKLDNLIATRLNHFKRETPKTSTLVFGEQSNEIQKDEKELENTEEEKS